MYRLGKRSWVKTGMLLVLLSTFGVCVTSCDTTHQGETVHPATAAGAKAFMDAAEQELLTYWMASERAAWVQQNFITNDTEAIAADAQAELIGVTMRLASEAARFNSLDLDPALKRKLQMIKTALPLAAPADPALQAELSSITASMGSTYSRGKYCPQGTDGECMDLTEMSRIIGKSRDQQQLLDLWQGWRTISPPMREQYQRFVELGNAGAQDLGFADLGELWRSGYDMPADEFAVEIERLWQQVMPLYKALHCHVRASLAETYGADSVPETDLIPAHLLGNMWSQSWGYVYDLVAPEQSDPGYDLTELLQANGVDEREMVRFGERFFSSLGFEPLPESFWERSLFVKPADRDVVCHASAWNLDWKDDLRIKMCIEINDEDFVTIHHELGHNYYQRAYNSQSPLHQDSANDGFHEGIGDTIALSITPDYLVEVGLLDKVPSVEGDLGQLMKMALDKIAFLPFGMLVDQWRWKVFSGEIAPEDYNSAWWELREKYQGIKAPLPRSEADFDPGAKYHIPANTPYTRYFLAGILQFQLHRSLCELTGFEGPLHRCSIYDNKEAGRQLIDMLELGKSRPWHEALELLTGSPEMDATAIVDYFAPLMTWLDEQNKDRSCGW
jgi:peptidyl-dipeptidase A